jgi:glycosyltransferase involved in cell wall biosynthesis
MKIDISVVVPFYNAERYIPSCIKAVLCQTYPSDRYEIIMIDNNSQDRSTEIVRQFPSIQLLYEPTQGAYAARNRGINKSNGNIIAFTDPDCIPSPVWLERISMVMDSPEIKAVLGYRESGYESFLLSQLGAYQKAKDEYIFNNDIKELYYGSNNNMAVRREVFDELGLFLERIRGSDTIFIRRIVDRYSCRSMVYCPKIRVKHLEIDNVLKYFNKMFIYGRSSKMYRKIVHTRPLNRDEKIKVFRMTVRNQNHEFTKSVVLFTLISFSFVLGKLGSLSSIFVSNKDISQHFP